jgi:DNA-binding response OmpR family regulator
MKKLKVLLGGEESLFCDLKKAAREFWALDVVSAADGKQACAALLSCRVDLCILDCDLPRMSGLEVCRCVRSVNLITQPHVVLLTSKDRPEQVRAAYQAGADDFIDKPFNLEVVHFLVSAFAHKLSQDPVSRQELSNLDPLEQYRLDLASLTGRCSRI